MPAILYRQAALLTAGVALAHAFVDANKRTATLLGLLLLRRNGIDIEAATDILADLVEALVVAEDHDAATEHLETWLRTHVASYFRQSSSARRNVHPSCNSA